MCNEEQTTENVGTSSLFDRTFRAIVIATLLEGLVVVFALHLVGDHDGGIFGALGPGVVDLYVKIVLVNLYVEKVGQVPRKRAVVPKKSGGAPMWLGLGFFYYCVLFFWEMDDFDWWWPIFENVRVYELLLLLNVNVLNVLKVDENMLLKSFVQNLYAKHE